MQTTLFCLQSLGGQFGDESFAIHDSSIIRRQLVDGARADLPWVVKLPAPYAPIGPRFPRGRRVLVSGQRVNGWRGRSHAAARRSAFDAVAASWKIWDEEDSCALYRPACPVSHLICVLCEVRPGVRRPGPPKARGR